MIQIQIGSIICFILYYNIGFMNNHFDIIMPIENNHRKKMSAKNIQQNNFSKRVHREKYVNLDPSIFVKLKTLVNDDEVCKCKCIHKETYDAFESTISRICEWTFKKITEINAEEANKPSSDCNFIDEDVVETNAEISEDFRIE